MFEILVSCNVIALFTPENEIEPFYLCAVESFGTAKSILQDSQNHLVTIGEKYILCQYLQKLEFKPGSHNVRYRVLPGHVYIHPSMVVSLLVNLRPAYNMPIEEYIWLADSVK